MNFSLRTMMLLMIVGGTIPFWFEHFLIPFAFILIISIAMAVRGFSDTAEQDEIYF